MQEQASSGDGDYYSYSVNFCITIRLNTNILFGLLFGSNRIRIGYSEFRTALLNNPHFESLCNSWRKGLGRGWSLLANTHCLGA